MTDTIKLLSAVYSPDGYLTVEWERARYADSPGFFAQVYSKPPSSKTQEDALTLYFDIYDPNTVSCLLPFVITDFSEDYYVVLFELTEDGYDPATRSNPVQVTGF